MAEKGDTSPRMEAIYHVSSAMLDACVVLLPFMLQLAVADLFAALAGNYALPDAFLPK